MSQTNESCHMWKRQVTHGRIMSRMNEAYYICEWVMSHIDESCYTWMSPVTYEWVMSHIDESCHIWGPICTHTKTNRPRMDTTRPDTKIKLKMYTPRQTGLEYMPHHKKKEPCHVKKSHFTYGWVMSHLNKSCHVWMSRVTYDWVMSHMNESCQVWMSHVTYDWVMS